jgi:predicted nucleic acid-binding protein
VPDAVSNTSPLLYLYRIEALNWLPELFGEIWVPNAVVLELQAGQQKGYDVPVPDHYPWLHIIEPASMPSAWLSLDLGSGELAAMALALEHPEKIVLLDDTLARRIAQAAGLQVWGTLKILLEAKSQGLTETIKPLVDRLGHAGMWLSDNIRQRVLALAHED